MHFVEYGLMFPPDAFGVGFDVHAGCAARAHRARSASVRSARWP
jgi:hypothetical protein